MGKKIEKLLIKKIIKASKEKCSIILMTKKDFKKLFDEISLTSPQGRYEDLKNEETYYMGLKIYKTKDLSKGEIIVK